MLKSLDVCGFKSFADRTKFDFAAGITAVVGPNGSGKSNVVDAIKWILGDQSAKSLRGKEMLDVVFNGSAARKESPFAEATLTFDNATGFLPLDMPEVRIGRRLWRSGDAEYLINGSPARLKDVRNLFLGTGAGTSAYAIIEQGRVDQILQANATNRRLVFEEAAGISRYRKRKVEAERKLERVEQNLVRLEDIVRELEGRLTTLRSQAKKASKYHRVSTELREWWIGQTADELREFRRIETEQRQIAEAAETELAARESELEQMAAEITEADAEVEALEERLYGIEQRTAENRERIAEHRAALKYQDSSRDVIDREIATVRNQRATMRARQSEGRAELDHAERTLTEHRAELDRATELHAAETERHTAVIERIEELSAALTARRNQLAASQTARDDLTERIAEVGQRRITLEDRHAALGERIAELTGEETERLEQYRATETELAAAREHLAECERTRDRIATELRTLSDDQEQDRRTLAEWRERRSGCIAKIGILQDLDEREIGLGLGAKDLLHRARDCDYPPWNRIRGCVGDLLETASEHAALIEIALGSRAEDLVIQEFDSLLEYLASGTARLDGQVGFLSVTESGTVLRAQVNDSLAIPEPRPLDSGVSNRRLDTDPRVIARADRLVTGPEFWPALAEVLLGRVWIVDTLTTARELANSAPGDRFVTRQGEVWERGRLQVGLPRTDTGLISRKSELRTLRNSLSGIDDELARLTNELTLRQGRLEQVRADWQTADETVAEAAQVATAAQGVFAEQSQLLVRIRAERDRFANDQNELIAERTALDVELDHMTTDRDRIHGEIAEVRDRIELDQESLTEQTGQLTTFEDRLRELELQRATGQERVAASETALARLRKDLHAKADQDNDADERWETVRSRQRDLTLQWLNTSAELAECLLAKDRFEAQVRQRRSELTERKAIRAAIGGREANLRRATREQETLRHRAELAIRELTQKRESLAERMEEEYGLTLDEVAASDLSAWTLYLTEATAAETEPTEGDTDSELPPDPEAALEPEPTIDPDTLTDEERNAIRREIEERVSTLRRQARSIGSVNTESLNDLEELEGRFGRLKTQLDDLTEARRTLEEIVRKINIECKRLFAETFETIREHFRDLFRKLFGGGEGDVVLEDPEDMLDCGIEIVARPPGKELRSMSLLSGGEKTLTAVALLLAIFKSKPSPFCILDEVDAALDDANITRFVNVLKEFVESTQFVMITHRKPSMTVADVLYGVTMEEAGVSKKLSVRFDEVDSQGNFITKTGNAA